VSVVHQDVKFCSSYAQIQENKAHKKLDGYIDIGLTASDGGAADQDIIIQYGHVFTNGDHSFSLFT